MPLVNHGLNFYPTLCNPTHSLCLKASSKRKLSSPNAAAKIRGKNTGSEGVPVVKNAPPKGRTLFLAVLLAVMTFASFWPVCHSDFVRLDDGLYVTSNPHVRSGLTWANVGWAFRTGYQANWHPVTWISHMLDVQLFGLRPGPHHFVNLLFHAANAVLLFLLLLRLTGTKWRAFFVAALFALHPLRVESVAWVSERKDVLSTFFFMLTLLAYWRYVTESKTKGRKSKVFYLLTLGCFALGLMAKPMLVTLPFVLLLLDYWPLQRFQYGEPSAFKRLANLVWEKVPFFVLSAVSCVVTFLVQDKGHATTLVLPIGPRVINTLVSYVKYLGITFWPAHLAAFYPHPDMKYPLSQQWPWWGVAAAAVLLAAITVYALKNMKRWPWLAVGWSWYLGTLVPVIGLIQVGDQALADRYTYIPLIGIFVTVVWSASEFCTGRWKISAASVASQPTPPDFAGKMVFITFGLLVVLACAACTRKQVAYWHDDSTLFGRMLTVMPDNPAAHYQIGTILGEQGNFADARTHFEAALRAEPNYAPPYLSLGYILEKSGDYALAMEHYQSAVRLAPRWALAHTRLGSALWALNRRGEAQQEYAEALRLDGDSPEAHYQLGLAYTSAGQFDNAASQFTDAARLESDNVQTLSVLAETLLRLNRLDAAESRLAALARLSPTNVGVRINLGQLYLKTGQTDRAVEQCAAAVRLAPELPLTHFNLGMALNVKKNSAQAAAQFAEAVHLKPDYVAALAHLGEALSDQGKFDEAQERFRQAVQLSPTNVLFRLQLAQTLLSAGRTNDAAAVYAEAVRLDPRLGAIQSAPGGATPAGVPQVGPK